MMDYRPFPGRSYRLFLGIIILSCTGCGNDSTPPATETIQVSADPAKTVPAPEKSTHAQTQFTVGNKRYLFDVSRHSIEELESLLQRTEEIAHDITAEQDDLEIVMILHGPDLEWFIRENYARYRKMVDLAASLDAMKIIDLKACKTAMDSRGIDPGELPAFIEAIPYAPDEIARLLDRDYVNL